MPPKLVRLMIDGEPVEVERQTTILEAAHRIGIEIPTLCYHKALEPHSGCRLCMVEVEGRGELVASCSQPVEPGMAVSTTSSRVQRARRLMVELLYLRCPEVPRIQALAHEFQVDTQALTKRFKPDNETCILCDLCVRICKERMRVNAFDYVNRGHLRKVSTPYNQLSPLCLACGACQTVCPLGTVDLASISVHTPRPIFSEHDVGLSRTGPIYIPFPQSVPKLPVIDRDTCMYFQRGVCQTCQAVCEAGAIDHQQKDTTRSFEVGAVVLAIGGEVVDPTLKYEYGYGRWPNVITGIQMERLLSASGPNSGILRRPSDSKPPERVAFIQCVGSRQIGRDYCSSVCCMYATKQALVVKENYPGAECSIFYIDMRSFGKSHEALLDRARNEGVRYIRCHPSLVRQRAGTQDLVLQYVSNNGQIIEDNFSLVVLATGIQPTPDASTLSEMLGLQQDRYGFIQAHLMNPTATSMQGVFAAGTITGPKDISESVTQASATASEVMAFLAEQRGTQVNKTEYPTEGVYEGDNPRIGIFICHCGRNIAGVVNLTDVREQSRLLPDIMCIEEELYLCSAEGQAGIKQKIVENHLNRIVIAACSPRTHQPLFRNAMREAGLNPHLLEMANIRDQCSWVHYEDQVQATRKAVDLVRMAAVKARLLEPIQPIRITVQPRALIIGGGVAGMTAALQLANQGLEVYLLEQTSQLGGNLDRLKYTLGGPKPQTHLQYLGHQITGQPLVRIIYETNLISVEGSVGDFRTRFTSGTQEYEIQHGAIIIATGARDYRPHEYRYGDCPEVITQLELEGRLDAGELQAKTIVMLQCVGSRGKYHRYCSRVCCLQAVKNANLIKDKYPDVNIYIAYQDMQTYGLYENAYQEARRRGIRFVRLAEGSQPLVEGDASFGRLVVALQDDILKTRLDIKADLVVLSSGIEPDPANRDLAQKLGVTLSGDGFFLEAHPKLRPVDSQTEGIFICGLALGPKTVEESIIQAGAAAARAATILTKPYLEIDNPVAEVQDRLCDGCAYCIEPCPFAAITLIEIIEDGAIRKSVQVDPAKCRGCGICQAVCPKLAIALPNYRPEQLTAMIDAALASGALALK